MKTPKHSLRKIVSFLNNPDEDGGFWLPNIQRPFVGEKIKFVDCSTPSCGSTQIKQLQKFDADELFDVIRSKDRCLEITEERF